MPFKRPRAEPASSDSSVEIVSKKPKGDVFEGLNVFIVDAKMDRNIAGLVDTIEGECAADWCASPDGQGD
jgi:hypothetical protein